MLAVFFSKFSPEFSVGAYVGEEVSQRVNLEQEIGEFLMRKSEDVSTWKAFDGFKKCWLLLGQILGRVMEDVNEGGASNAIP